MNLLEYIDSILTDDVVIHMSFIRKDKDTITVGFLPKPISEDKGLGNLQQLVMSGTVKELEDNFIETTSSPAKTTAQFASNLSDFEKSQERAKANSEIAAEEKKKEKKEKEEMKKAEDELDAWIEKNKADKIACKHRINLVLGHHPTSAKLKALKKEYDVAAPSLFEEPTETVEEEIINEDQQNEQKAMF